MGECTFHSDAGYYLNETECDAMFPGETKRSYYDYTCSDRRTSSLPGFLDDALDACVESPDLFFRWAPTCCIDGVSVCEKYKHSWSDGLCEVGIHSLPLRTAACYLCHVQDHPDAFEPAKGLNSSCSISMTQTTFSTAAESETYGKKFNRTFTGSGCKFEYPKTHEYYMTEAELECGAAFNSSVLHSGPGQSPTYTGVTCASTMNALAVSSYAVGDANAVCEYDISPFVQYAPLCCTDQISVCEQYVDELMSEITG